MQQSDAREVTGSHLSPKKRAQILEGARAVFAEVGYAGASMDAIAKRAKVSKATIYNHFQDKQALFIAGFGAETETHRAAFEAMLETPSGDIEADLRRVGRQLMKLILEPASVGRYRMVMAEAGKLPELGRALHASGAAVGQAKMARFFERAQAMGQIAAAPPEELVEDFSALCVGNLWRLLHLAVIDGVDEPTIVAKVDRAVKVFLRAYGTTPSESTLANASLSEPWGC